MDELRLGEPDHLKIWENISLVTQQTLCQQILDKVWQLLISLKYCQKYETLFESLVLIEPQ